MIFGILSKEIGNNEEIKMSEVKQREIWVDNVKVIACILVVLGHFFQSMTKAGILPANDLYQWFDQTIYYFHVPLFFICSGYLYQKLSKVEDISSWGKSMLKKALNLGVPYFTFSFVTWLLKTVFSGSTNDEIGGLFETLFFHPTPPYWYLYALFFIFLITPTFRNKTMAGVGLAIAAVLKVLGIMCVGGCCVQAVSYILLNEIWFVIGMCLSVFGLKEYMAKKKIALPLSVGVVFVALSVLVYKAGVQNGYVSFLLGLLACISIVILIIGIYRDSKQSMIFGVLAKYTMPIFVMHTLFAAPLRTVLLKVGIQNAAIHVILGIAISFMGPIIAALIMKKSKWLEFFLYPGKFVNIR